MPEYYTRYPRPILWLVPEGEVEVDGERHAVAPFYLSKLPVTNEQFEAFDPGFERSPASAGDRDPALGVSFEDAVEYAAWYAEVARKPIRLPSAREWRYACLGGAQGGSSCLPADDPAAADAFLWHAGNVGGAGGGRLPPLEEKRANGFGFYGLLGGAWEWTADGTLHGGSFRTPLAEISCAARRRPAASEAPADAGFRIAKSLR